MRGVLLGLLMLGLSCASLSDTGRLTDESCEYVCRSNGADYYDFTQEGEINICRCYKQEDQNTLDQSTEGTWF